MLKEKLGISQYHALFLSSPKSENQLRLVDFSASPEVWNVATLDNLAPVPEGQGFSVTLGGGS